MFRIIPTAVLALIFAGMLYAQRTSTFPSNEATVTPKPMPNLLPKGAIGRIVAEGGASPISSGLKHSATAQGVTGPKGGSLSPNANSSAEVGRSLNSNTAHAAELITR